MEQVIEDEIMKKEQQNMNLKNDSNIVRNEKNLMTTLRRNISQLYHVRNRMK